MSPQIEALLREREHYVRRGLSDRADAVTAELTRLGHEEATPEPAAPEAAVVEAPPETTTPPRPKARQPRSPK